MSIMISIDLAFNLTMMSVSTSHLAFCYQDNRRREPKFVNISCISSNEFRKEISALNSKSADVDQLKKAYRKLALRYHPDVCDPSMRAESTRMFVELQKTYVNLLDQESQTMVRSETSKARSKWESQISELKRRSHSRQEQKDGSWGSRMRAKQHGP